MTASDDPEADVARQAERFQRVRDAHQTEMAEDYVELIADLIDKKGEALMQAASNVLQQAAGAQAGGGAGPDAGASGGADAQSKAHDDAVDAEFEEVKDKKKAS